MKKETTVAFTPAQSRAGRALLDWSQEQLAAASHLGLSTIRDFEKGRRVPTHNNLRGIQLALEAGGVELIEENGGGGGVGCRTPWMDSRGRGFDCGHDVYGIE